MPPETVQATACCRVDLAGGTLDIWPLGLLHPGARTLCLAIDRTVSVRLSRRPKGYEVRQGGASIAAPDLPALAGRAETALVGLLGQELQLPPSTIELESASPRGGGLGASSAMAVAFIAAAEAFRGEPASSVEYRAALARDLEARLMGLPTGMQDHYAALLGGVLEIQHLPGQTRVGRLEVDLDELRRHLLVVYTGQSHFSAGSNWQMIRRRLDGEGSLKELFQGIAETAMAMADALRAQDFPRVGLLMGREWSFRRQLAPGISTPEIEALLRAAEQRGAWGGKVCGAGGGGCVAVLCPAEKRQAVEEGVEAAGGEILPTAPSTRALEVSFGS